MLWVYGHYNFVCSLSVGIDFGRQIVYRRQVLTSKDGSCNEKVT